MDFPASPSLTPVDGIVEPPDPATGSFGEPLISIFEPRILARAITLLFVLLCVAGQFLPGANWGAGGLTMAVGLAMTICSRCGATRSWRRRAKAGSAWRDSTWWDAQAFSYILAGLCVLPITLMPGTIVAALFLGLSIALGLLSALTPFCAGRFLFIVLFRRRPSGTC